MAQRRQGFTILEIILVVALLSLIVVAIAPYFRTTVAGWELKDRQLEILQIGRMGMDEMTRKIKGATSFSKAEDDKVKFEDPNGNDIEYKFDTDKVKKNNKELIEPANSLAFIYYDRDGAVTTDTFDVRSVLITLVVPDSEGKVDPVTFSSMVMVRKDEIGEGVIFSKNADFSTADFTFTTADTFYIKIWTGQVDYTDLKKAEYQLKKGGTTLNYNLDNNMDYTYTDSVNLSGFATGTWDVRKMKVEDNAGNKYEPANSQITITSP